MKIAYGILAVPLAFLTLLMLHIVAQNVYANAHDLQQFQPVLPALIESSVPILLWCVGVLGFRVMRGSPRSWLGGAIAFLGALVVALAYRLMPFIIYVIESAARSDAPSGPMLP